MKSLFQWVLFACSIGLAAGITLLARHFGIEVRFEAVLAGIALSVACRAAAELHSKQADDNG